MDANCMIVKFDLLFFHVIHAGVCFPKHDSQIKICGEEEGDLLGMERYAMMRVTICDWPWHPCKM